MTEQLEVPAGVVSQLLSISHPHPKRGPKWLLSFANSAPCDSFIKFIFLLDLVPSLECKLLEGKDHVVLTFVPTQMIH